MSSTDSENAIVKLVKKKITSKYGKDYIKTLPSFMDTVANIAQKNGLTVGKFNTIRLKSVKKYSNTEKTKMLSIRNSIPKPTKDTLMQKVVPFDDIKKYISGEYQVKGFVSRAQDTKMLKTYSDYYNSLRLDYSGTKFNLKKDKSMGVIRFKSNDSSRLNIPYTKEMGGSTIIQPPGTGNGFTAAKNGNILPEYVFPDKNMSLLDGAEIYEINQYGKEILRAVYDKNLNKFIPVEIVVTNV